MITYHIHTLSKVNWLKRGRWVATRLGPGVFDESRLRKRHYGLNRWYFFVNNESEVKEDMRVLYIITLYRTRIIVMS